MRERICTCCGNELGARVEDTIALRCGHAFCKPCIIKAVCDYNRTSCFDCRMEIGPDCLITIRSWAALIRPAREPRFQDVRLNPTSPFPTPGVVDNLVSQPAPTSLYEVCSRVEGLIYTKVVDLNTRCVLHGWPLQYHKLKQALWANGNLTGTGAANLEDIDRLFEEL